MEEFEIGTILVLELGPCFRFEIPPSGCEMANSPPTGDNPHDWKESCQLHHHVNCPISWIDMTCMEMSHVFCSCGNESMSEKRVRYIIEEYPYKKKTASVACLLATIHMVRKCIKLRTTSVPH